MRFLSIILIFFSLINAHAFESFSYSGRLVNNNGSPVTGYAKLSFELAYSSNVGAILCVENVDNVSLSNGVFHVGLKFSGCNLVEVIKNTPEGQTLSIRVIDRTQAIEKAYSFQAIHSLPYAFVSQTSKQLDQMGATSGQVLNWENGEWKPKTIMTEIADGSVTNDMLSGNILRSKISVGMPNEIVVNDLSGNLSSINLVPLSLGGTGASDAASARTNLGAMAFTDVPNCLSHQKLQMNPGPVYWSCGDDEVTDNSKLPLTGGTLTGSLVLPADPTSSLEAATKAYVDSQVGDVTSSQWTTVGASDISYVGSASVSGIKFKPNSFQVELKANNTITENLLFILPSGKGTLGQALVTDGNGNLSWAAPAAADSSAIGGELSGTVSNATININTISSSKIIDGTIVDDDISPTAGIAQTKIAGLQTDLGNKEPTLSAGTTDQYYRGDKTWQNFDSAARGAKLSGYVKIPGNVTDGDSLQTALGKIDDSFGRYVLRDGSSVITSDFTLSNKKIINLADPTLAQDAATKSYVDTKVGDAVSGITNLDATKISAGIVTNTEFDYLNNLTGNIQSQIDSKQGTITPGTSAQYYRGDKSWQTLNTDAVPEGTKLYFTEPLVLGTDLAGFVSGAGLVSSTDNVLTAIQKLDGNIGAVSTNQSNYILRDGSSAITNDLTLSNKKIIDLADPTLAQDAATKAYVDLKAGEASQWLDDGSDIYFNTGRVGIGNNDPAMPLHITSTGWGTILAEKVSNDNAGAEIHFSKSRGTTGSLLPVDSGDRLMSLFGSGSYSATQFTSNVVSIEMKAAENFSGTAQGTSIEFGTTGLGTTTRLPRMTIAPSGFVGINTTNPQSSLDVRGTLRLGGATSGYVGFAPAAVAGNTTYTLPSADGSDGHVLKTNGSGVLSWGTPTSVINNLNSTQISDGSIDNMEFGYLNGVSSNIQTQMNEKQNITISGFSAASFLQVNNGDSVVDALGKLQGQVNVNQTAFNSTGQWGKNVNDIFFNTGNVGIGTNAPVSKLQVIGGDLTLDSNRGIASTTGAKFFSGPAGHTWHVQSGDPIASIFIGKDFSGTTKFMFDNVGNLSVEGLIASNTGGFRFPDGSIQTTASGSPAAFMKKTMTAYQTVDLGSIVNFNTVYSGNGGLTATGNGIDLKAGHTYRLEASLNTHLGDGNGYLGYTFYNGTTNFGHGAYTDEPDSNGSYGFHSSLLEFYTPSVDTTVYVRIFDDNLGNGQVTPNYNTYFVVTEMVAGGISGASDNLGSHQAAQNIQLGSHWLSGDGGNEGIKIDANGNVGIGTNTPAQKLVVAGDINSNQEYSTSFTFPNGWAVGDWREVVQVNPASASGSSQYEVHISSTRNSWVDASTYMVGGAHQGANVWREAAQTYETTYGGNTKCFTVDFNGAARTIRVRALKASASCGVEDINIPITFKVRSLGQNTSWVPIASSGSGGTVTGVQSQTASWNLYTGDPKLNAGNLAIHANAQGKIGIGTNAPVEKIHVAGSERMIFGPNATWGAHLIVGGNGWTGPHATVAATDGNLHLESRSGGYTTYLNWYSATGGVRVGNGSGGGYGPIAASAFNISSDQRLKTNIKTLKDTAAKISQIRGVTYKYKDKKFNQDQQIGVIAQEVEKVFPEAIQKDEKGMLSVNYPVLVAPLIEAFKELQAKVEKLFFQKERVNREIASLKQENAELKKENQEMKEAVCEINPKARICQAK